MGQVALQGLAQSACDRRSNRRIAAEKGVALVTTLIMLSLVTFMSVAFLALSRRERAAVQVSMDQMQAKMVADMGLHRAQADIVTQMLAATNRWEYDLLVSTNYISASGFVSGNTNVANVNYVDASGNALNAGDQITNIYNLFYDPRPPVYIDTNSGGGNGPLEFRFFVDFNRNGLFEWTDRSASTNVVGDPQWIGVLEKPGFDANGVPNRHSGNNRFFGRYAYLVMPAGKSLDLNYVHNQSKYLGAASEGFLRNQGFANYEINLAGFLRDLNTNLWGYNYSTNPAAASTGSGFDDALQLARYRYNSNYFNLSNVAALYGNTGGDVAFQTDMIDGLGDGPLMTDIRLLSADNDNVNIFNGWFGSPVPQPFFDVQQLFDTNQVFSAGFTARLRNLWLNTNFYNRYTFYRMLAQLGVNSGLPSTNKVHLNYVNYTNLTGNPIANYQTNFLSWGASTNDAAGFFTLVADRLLKQVFNNTVSISDASKPLEIYNTNNPGVLVYPSDVHRQLQLAANILDATQTNIYPTVFRPQFTRSASNLVISSYVVEPSTNFLLNPFRSLSNNAALSLVNSNDNVYGVPLVIGAKKGFPSFNEFTVETVMEVTRKLEIYKNTNTVPPTYYTNQMIILGVTNVVGAEAWNSYMSAYPRPFQLFMTNNYSAGMTNELGVNILSRGPTNILQVPPTTYTTWPSNAFFVSVTNQPILTNSIYTNAPPYWVPLTPAQYSRPPSGFPTPTWNLNITNRLVYGVIDNGRIVDFVSLDNLTVPLDLSQLLIGNGPAPNEPAVVAAFWDTNRLNGSTNINVATIGVNNQINVSLGQPRLPPNVWTYISPTVGPTSTDTEINKFRVFMGLTPFQPLTPAEASLVQATTNMAAPLAPTRKVYNIQRWAADDPLVHYTLGDLVHPVPGLNPESLVVVPSTLSYQQFTKANFRKPIDQRQYTPYSPWGGKRAPGYEPVSSATNSLDYDLSLKDPLIRWSDDWDFPTNKFGNIGWLGRVHRGTPWQTVYFKALVANPTTWLTNRGSLATHPTNDWLLADLFTIAPNEDTARGLLSINQTNFAAWSAVLSGILVLSNTTDYALNPPSTLATFADVPINPSSPELVRIYNAINAGRDSLTNTPRYTFTNVSQLLAIPELTVGYSSTVTNGQPDVFSPYLRSGVIAGDDPSGEMKYGLNDVAYERIPQQLLSLVTLEDHPRIVVYAFGQSLKPAERSVVLTPGPTRGLCTNYQITGEVVTRTVLRIENAPLQPRVVVEAYNVLTSD